MNRKPPGAKRLAEGALAQNGAVAVSLLPVRLPCMRITVAMAERYFLNKLGIRTTRMRGLPGEGHIDIGRENLAREGIVPADDHAVYTQMFRLQFVRVVEHDDGRVEVEHGRPLTNHQKRFLTALED